MVTLLTARKHTCNVHAVVVWCAHSLAVVAQDQLQRKGGCGRGRGTWPAWTVSMRVVAR